MKTPKTLLIATLLIGLAGCGKAPDLTTNALTATAEAAPAPMHEYDELHLPEACAALRAWDPATASIQVTDGPVGSAGTSVFTFTAAKITQKGTNGPLATIDYTTSIYFRIHATGVDACVPHITAGKLTSVP